MSENEKQLIEELAESFTLNKQIAGIDAKEILILKMLKMLIT